VIKESGSGQWAENREAVLNSQHCVAWFFNA